MVTPELAPGDPKTTTVAEESSGMSTKQLLGYMWPVALLKKHSKQVPKKLQTITHQGKQVKGLILEENVVGVWAYWLASFSTFPTGHIITTTQHEIQYVFKSITQQNLIHSQF